ncbi:MAG: MBL fold metallo-hydrolase [Thaumarchaeota archaeon]|nr:MBL fold metallo-hydrolase [Nitrososphaerota archaeon]
MSPIELKLRLARPISDRPIILDIQEPQEYRDWRIQGSLNIPLNVLHLPQSPSSLPKDKEIITVCAHGVKSSEVAKFLRSKGYNARSLAGGLAAWNNIYDTVPVAADDVTDFKLLQIRRLGKGCASYIAAYQGQCAIIDPSMHIEEYEAIAQSEGLRIVHVMDTHQQADHVSGARALARDNGARFYLNPLDGFRYADFTPLKDGYTVTLGDGGVTIEAMHTPGHTKGSTSFLVQDRYILTGDTLFVEGVGRPDLGNNAREYALDLYDTYQERLLKLSENVIVLPAHFSQSVYIEFLKAVSATIGEIRKRMPIVDADREEFLKQVLAKIPSKPPNHLEILRINRGEVRYGPTRLSALEEGPNRCAIPT